MAGSLKILLVSAECVPFIKQDQAICTNIQTGILMQNIYTYLIAPRSLVLFSSLVSEKI